MQEPLKNGDLCMVVRDNTNKPHERCYGSLIGAPFTLGDPHPLVSYGWRTASPLTCPRCRNVMPFVCEDEIQKLRGPEQRSDVSELIGMDENGNGWRPTTSEVGS